MDFQSKAERWFRTLPDELRQEARTTVGPLPRWIVDSLLDAGISPVPLELRAHDGAHAFMMPARLVEFLNTTWQPERPV